MRSIHRMVALVVLAGTAAFVACGDEVPTAPDVVESSATANAAPLPSPLEMTCTYFGGSLHLDPCDENAARDFYDAGDNNHVLQIAFDVRPATQGVLTLQLCLIDSQEVAASFCVNHEGGRWVIRSRHSVTPSTNNWAFRNVLTDQTVGMKMKYTAQGSGFTNSTVIFTVFANDLEP